MFLPISTTQSRMCVVTLHKDKAETDNQIISEEEKHWDKNLKSSYFISDLTKKKS